MIRITKVLPVLVAGMLLISGCTAKEGELERPGPETTAPVNLTGSPAPTPAATPTPVPTPSPSKAPAGTPVPTPFVKLEPIPYTKEQLRQIAEQAAEAGLKTVYLPKLGVEDSPLMKFDFGEKAMGLYYKYMDFVLSTEKHWQEPKEGEIKKVRLANGIEGEWLNGEDRLPRNRFFRFQVKGLYISMDDYRFLPEEQVQAIAESFVPLDDLSGE